jgi:hypothetical protein
MSPRWRPAWRSIRPPRRSVRSPAAPVVQPDFPAAHQDTVLAGSPSGAPTILRDHARRRGMIRKGGR